MTVNQSNRYETMCQWAEQVLGSSTATSDISLLSGDASFRRYFRVVPEQGARVLVDADPQHEDNQAFVQIARAIQATGVAVPEVFAADFESGFLLLSDFGDQLLLPALQADTVDGLYGAAIETLIQMQKTQCDLPAYDADRLRAEMALFDQWFLTFLRIEPHFDLSGLYQTLIDSALAQPTVFVHRDYHSRNLMILPNQTLGVLDFQDAVIGPVTYDLVSLLRDCYISWPASVVDSFIKQYHRLSESEVDLPTFQRWFDWMGLQRHLKCVGIFTRLNCRDGKPGYMADIPRVLEYILQVAQKYPEFSELHTFILTIQDQFKQYESNATRRGTWQPIEATDRHNA